MPARCYVISNTGTGHTFCVSCKIKSFPWNHCKIKWWVYLFTSSRCPFCLETS